MTSARGNISVLFFIKVISSGHNQTNNDIPETPFAYNSFNVFPVFSRYPILSKVVLISPLYRLKLKQIQIKCFTLNP